MQCLIGLLTPSCPGCVVQALTVPWLPGAWPVTYAPVLPAPKPPWTWPEPPLVSLFGRPFLPLILHWPAPAGLPLPGCLRRPPQRPLSAWPP